MAAHLLLFLISLSRFQVGHLYLYLQLVAMQNIEDSSKSKKKPVSANPSGIRRGRKPYPIDADGNKIRPENENKEPGQKQKKSK